MDEEEPETMNNNDVEKIVQEEQVAASNSPESHILVEEEPVEQPKPKTVKLKITVGSLRIEWIDGEKTFDFGDIIEVSPEKAEKIIRNNSGTAIVE